LAAVVNYKRAIELDPSSTSNREYLEKAEAKLRAGGSGGVGGDNDAVSSMFMTSDALW